jgi:hypothetical protein
MPANNKAMMKKPAPHEATASGQMPAYKDKAMMTKFAPNKAVASGQMPADKDKPLVHKFLFLLGRGESLVFFFNFWLFNIILFTSLWQRQEQHEAAASGWMPADKAMTTKPACGDDPSVDDKELAIAVVEDKEEPLAVDWLKKMPKRSRCFGRVTRGVPSCSKQQCTNTNINLDVYLDVISAPINVTIDPPIQDLTVSVDDDRHVPPQANVITQLRKKVHDSTVRNDKLTQLVAELKNEVRDLKHHAKESDTAHAKLVVDLKSKYCELVRDKQRDRSLSTMWVCAINLLIVFINNIWHSLLSVKLNKIEMLRSNLHEKMKSVDVSTMNAKKETASIIYAEHAFASAKIEGPLKSFLEKLQIMPRDWGQCITTICALTIPKHIIIK